MIHDVVDVPHGCVAPRGAAGAVPSEEEPSERTIEEPALRVHGHERAVVRVGEQPPQPQPGATRLVRVVAGLVAELTITGTLTGTATATASPHQLAHPRGRQRPIARRVSRGRVTGEKRPVGDDHL